MLCVGFTIFSLRDLDWGRQRLPQSRQSSEQYSTFQQSSSCVSFLSLSLTSQVCLAISSKRFHQLFSYVLEAEELHFPRMPRNGLAYITTEQYNIRMSLLIQLQNDNWACCGRCQRLHPSREFSAQQLIDYDPWNRTCMAWAGILDLCPCIPLIVRDRTHIVKYLKSPKHRKSKLKSIDDGLLLLTGGQQLEHQCRAYPHVQISMRLSLTDHDELILDTQYEVPSLDVPWREIDGSMPLCCSQVWLDVFRHQEDLPGNALFAMHACCSSLQMVSRCACSDS